MNGISHVYHLSISTKHVSVSRTEPIDGIHYVFHSCMMHWQPEMVLGAPGIRLSYSGFFSFKAGSIPSTRQAKDLPETAEFRLHMVM